MKNPTTAPSNDKIRLTSILRTPTKVADTKNKIVKPMKSFFSIWGLFTKVMNYLRVKNNKIGRTEKFWKKIPHWTILPMMKNTVYYVVYLLLKQSKIVE